MPLELPSPIFWNVSPIQENIREARFRRRGELKIKIPAVPEALRKRWHGMPPTKLDVRRLGGTIAF